MRAEGLSVHKIAVRPGFQSHLLLDVCKERPMGAFDLAPRLDPVYRRDSPKSVPAGQVLSGAVGGTYGTSGTAETRGTVGKRERSEDDLEERAGMAADSVPALYLKTWARINHQKPLRVSEADWRRALNDGGRFLDA